MRLFLFILELLTLTIQAQAVTLSQPAEELLFRSVVQLIIPAVDSSGDEVNGYCNGTLISDRKILTAAHCVVNSKLFSNEPLQLEVGEYRYKETPTGRRRIGYFPLLKHASAVTITLNSKVSPNANPNSISPDNDYALIDLKDPVALPQGFVFPEVWNQGLSGISISESYVVSVNLMAYVSTVDTKRIALLDKIQFLGNSAKSTSTSRIEEGDSGAPLFITVNGRIYLVGVVKGLAKTFFSEWDAFSIWANRL